MTLTNITLTNLTFNQNNKRLKIKSENKKAISNYEDTSVEVSKNREYIESTRKWPDFTCLDRRFNMEVNNEYRRIYL